jgi:hypothetical protein
MVNRESGKKPLLLTFHVSRFTAVYFVLGSVWALPRSLAAT